MSLSKKTTPARARGPLAAIAAIAVTVLTAGLLAAPAHADDATAAFDPGNIAGYLAIGEELDPAPLLARLASKGARLVLPRVESDGAMTFRDASRATLEKGPFGLTQPSASAEIVRPNLVLTPLLAFDARGRRLGYGKGHYDKAITAMRSTGRIFYLGLAYAQQQVDAVPVDRHDVLLDWVETPLNSVPLFLGRALAR